MSDTMVRLDFPLFRGSLNLKRTPKYLRFAYKGAGIAACARAWDALDQPDDTPAPGEELIGAVLKDRGNVHVDGVRNGKRFGEWYATANYEPMAPQPTQETMRDYTSWVALCVELESGESPAGKKPD